MPFLLVRFQDHSFNILFWVFSKNCWNLQLIHVYFAFLLAVSMFQLNGSSILPTGQTLSSSLQLQQRHESSLDDHLKSSTSLNEVKPLLSSAMQPAAPVGDALSIQKVCMLTFFSSAGLDATIELSYHHISFFLFGWLQLQIAVSAPSMLSTVSPGLVRPSRGATSTSNFQFFFSYLLI